MAYDTSRLVTPICVAVSEAIGAVTHYYKAPASGRLFDINLSTTTTWAGATNQLIVEVGTAADNDLYGELRSGTAAAATAGSSRYTMSDNVSELHHSTNEFAKGDTIQVTITPPAGSGEAGAGIVSVTFELNG